MHVHLSITQRQIPCQPVPVHLKEPFKYEIDMMLQAGILKPVHQATPLDKQPCFSGREGQAWQTEVKNLFGPNQSK